MSIKYIKSLDDDNYGQIECKDGEKTVGSLSYKICEHKRAWLYMIQVEESYRNQGIGTALLNIFEDVCADKWIRHIEGKYYPEGGNVRDFYEHRGYSIYKEGYTTYVGKYYPKTQNLDGLNVVEGREKE